jgi:hypothetical protein
VVVQGTWREIVDKLQLGASMSMSWLNDQTKWGLALDDLRVPSVVGGTKVVGPRLAIECSRPEAAVAEAVGAVLGDLAALAAHTAAAAAAAAAAAEGVVVTVCSCATTVLACVCLSQTVVVPIWGVRAGGGAQAHVLETLRTSSVPEPAKGCVDEGSCEV